MSRSFKALTALCLAAGTLTPLVSKANPTNSTDPTNTHYPYATLQLGVGFPNDLTGQLEEASTDINTRLNANTGFYGDVGVGYKFGDFRSDLTFGYNNYGGVRQSLSAPGFGSATRDADGNLQLFTVMLNGYYDIPIRKSNGERSRWSPYLGAGVGYGSLSVPDCSFTADCYNGGSIGGFAYQGKVGLSYRATERGFAFLEGGYLGMTGASLNAVDFDDFGGWRVSLGWRQGFGGAPKAVKVVNVAPEPVVQPTAPVQPAPTPAPAAPQPIRGLW
jgi:hypothetical protein